MTDAPQITERPLVTFALFAFNQERFVREAVEGAFAQSYQPLEIILSDDCSTDHTFEIMQAMAAAYQGPHRVRARQTRRNSGTLNHLFEVEAEAEGALMVLAAGDDVSLPVRTSTLVEEWRATGAWGISSHFDVVNEDGRLIRADDKVAGDSELLIWIGDNMSGPFVHGGTSCYDRRVFRSLERSESPIFSEDVVLTLSIHLRGEKTHRISKPLIRYREHAGAFSNNGQAGGSLAEVKEFEVKIAKAAEAYINLCNYCLILNKHAEADRKLEQRIEATRRFARLRVLIHKGDSVSLARAWILARSRREFRYLLPRALSIAVYAKCKSYLIRLRRSALPQ